MLGTFVLLAVPAGPLLEVSFDEAVCAATKNGSKVVLADRRVAVAAAEVSVAGELLNPTLSVQTARRTARLGTALSVPLPLFGQIGKSEDAAIADRDTIELELESAKLEARWQGACAWIDLWEAESRALLLEEATASATELVGAAEQRFEAGTGPRLDLVRARADRALARANLAESRASVQAFAAILGTWVPTGPESTLRTTGMPSYPRKIPALAVLDRHPVLLRDEAAVGAAQAHQSKAERLRWPILNGLLGLDQFDPGLDGPDLIIGLSFELPVLGRRSGEIDRALAEQALARAQLAADRRQIATSLLSARARASGALAKIDTFETEAVPAMAESRQMTEDGWRDGRVDLYRVLEARRALLEVKLAGNEARASYYRAMADLERATGAALARGPDDAR